MLYQKKFRFLTENVSFGAKLTVFEQKGSEAWHTKSMVSQS
jgi:hypothetical protein